MDEQKYSELLNIIDSYYNEYIRNVSVRFVQSFTSNQAPLLFTEDEMEEVESTGAKKTTKTKKTTTKKKKKFIMPTTPNSISDPRSNAYDKLIFIISEIAIYKDLVYKYKPEMIEKDFVDKINTAEKGGVLISDKDTINDYLKKIVEQDIEGNLESFITGSDSVSLKSVKEEYTKLREEFAESVSETPEINIEQEFDKKIKLRINAEKKYAASKVWNYYQTILEEKDTEKSDSIVNQWLKNFKQLIKETEDNETLISKTLDREVQLRKPKKTRKKPTQKKSEEPEVQEQTDEAEEPAIPDVTETEQMEVVEEPDNQDTAPTKKNYKKLYKKKKKKSKSNEQKIKELEQQIEINNEKIAEQNLKLDQMKEQATRITELEEEIINITESKKQDQLERDELIKQLESLQKTQEDNTFTDEDIETIDNIVKTSRERVNELNGMIENYRDKIEKLNRKMVGLRSEKQAFDEIKQKIESLQIENENLTENINDILQELNIIYAENRRLKNEISNYKNYSKGDEIFISHQQNLSQDPESIYERDVSERYISLVSSFMIYGYLEDYNNIDDDSSDFPVVFNKKNETVYDAPSPQVITIKKIVETIPNDFLEREKEKEIQIESLEQQIENLKLEIDRLTTTARLQPEGGIEKQKKENLVIRNQIIEYQGQILNLESKLKLIRNTLLNAINQRENIIQDNKKKVLELENEVQKIQNESDVKERKIQNQIVELEQSDLKQRELIRIKENLERELKEIQDTSGRRIKELLKYIKDIRANQSEYHKIKEINFNPNLLRTTVQEDDKIDPIVILRLGNYVKPRAVIKEDRTFDVFDLSLSQPFRWNGDDISLILLAYFSPESPIKRSNYYKNRLEKVAGPSDEKKYYYKSESDSIMSFMTVPNPFTVDTTYELFDINDFDSPQLIQEMREGSGNFTKNIKDLYGYLLFEEKTDMIKIPDNILKEYPNLGLNVDVLNHIKRSL